MTGAGDLPDGARGGGAAGVPGSDRSVPRVTLVGKPGCHLCETARDVVVAVTTDLGLAWQEVSILDDPDLYDRYWEQIPVVLVDGVPHEYWRVDERRLRQALAAPDAGRRRWFRR